jgi:hypothetical protein
LVGELVGRSRTVRFFLGSIDRAATRYGRPYDRILYFKPAQRYHFVEDAFFEWGIPTDGRTSFIKLSHHKRDVRVLLDEIASQCKRLNTVAAMPFGGADNRAILDWIDEPGLPRELDIYFIDPDDYRDVLPSQSGERNDPQ